MTRGGLLALGIGALAIAVAVADPVAQQTRDTGGPAATPGARTGTSVLTGTIVTDDGKPVRRATVRLTGSDASSQRIGVTDDAGRFVFTRLPAASFTLSATKAGYVTSHYGSKRPGRGPAVPVSLAEGQRLALSFVMLRGAVITGTLTDAFGRPAPQVTMQAKAAASTPDALTPGTAPAATATTDDRGVFRIFGLAPGDYKVFALPRIGSAGESLIVTDDEVRWARAGGAGRASAPPPPGRALTYSPVFFSGTTDPESAAQIRVGPGEERGGIAFALRLVPTAKIEGTVMATDGPPASGVLMLLLPRASGSAAAFQVLFDAGLVGVPRAPVSPDGRFSMTGVTPGQYTLTARTGVVAAGRAAGPGPTTLWGETEVTVDGRDLSGVVVALQSGLKVTGTIAFESASMAPPADLSTVRVSMTSTRLGAAALMGNVLATIGPGTAIQFPSLMPGSYLIKATPPLAAPGETRWTLKAVTSGGRDVTDGPLELRPGENLDGVVITFTDRETEVAGTLLDAAGRPTQEFSIVVFTTGRAHWTPGSRRVQSVRPATNGTFRVVGLPAGDYAIAAVADLEPESLSDPAYLEQLQAAAFTFTLAEGEKKKQDFKIK